MTEPRRLKDEEGFDGALLRSADADQPSAESRRALEIALALAPLPLIGLAAKAGAAGSAGSAGSATGSAATVGNAAAGGLGPAAATKLAVSATFKLVAALSVTASVAGIVVVTPRFQAPPSAITEPHRRPAEIDRVPTPDRVAVDSIVAPVDDVKVEAVAPVVRAPQTRGPGRVPASSTTHVGSPRSAEPAATIAATPTPPPPTPPPLTLPPPTLPPPTPAGSAVDPASAAELPRSGLADELALLDRALAELRHRDVSAALAALDAYDRAFPAGTLVPEAAFARIEATIAAGDRVRARALGASFIAAHAGSPLARRVRTLIATIPP